MFIVSCPNHLPSAIGRGRGGEGVKLNSTFMLLRRNSQLSCPTSVIYQLIDYY